MSCLSRKHLPCEVIYRLTVNLFIYIFTINLNSSGFFFSLYLRLLKIKLSLSDLFHTCLLEVLILDATEGDGVGWFGVRRSFSPSHS